MPHVIHEVRVGVDADADADAGVIVGVVDDIVRPDDGANESERRSRLHGCKLDSFRFEVFGGDEA